MGTAGWNLPRDDSDPKNMYWIRDRLARLLAEHLSESERNAFVAEFNRDATPHRSVLANYLLWAWKDLTTDQFSDSAIDYLIATLRYEGEFSRFRGHLLGHVATESFVKDRLLPLLTMDSSIFQANLKQVLREAGRRHGRRYMVDEGSLS